MKISAERLKRIIKEEVQHVREMPLREETYDPYDDLEKIQRALVGKDGSMGLAGEMTTLVDLTAPKGTPAYQAGETFSNELVEIAKALAEVMNKLPYNPGAEEPQQ